MLVDDAELNLVDYLMPCTVKFVCSIILWIIQTLGIEFLYNPLAEALITIKRLVTIDFTFDFLNSQLAR